MRRAGPVVRADVVMGADGRSKVRMCVCLCLCLCLCLCRRVWVCSRVRTRAWSALVCGVTNPCLMATGIRVCYVVTSSHCHHALPTWVSHTCVLRGILLGTPSLVEFGSAAAARKAINTLHDTELDGRVIQVREVSKKVSGFDAVALWYAPFAFGCSSLQAHLPIDPTPGPRRGESQARCPHCRTCARCRTACQWPFSWWQRRSGRCLVLRWLRKGPGQAVCGQRAWRVVIASMRVEAVQDAPWPMLTLLSVGVPSLCLSSTSACSGTT